MQSINSGTKSDKALGKQQGCCPVPHIQNQSPSTPSIDYLEVISEAASEFRLPGLFFSHFWPEKHFQSMVPRHFWISERLTKIIKNPYCLLQLCAKFLSPFAHTIILSILLYKDVLAIVWFNQSFKHLAIPILLLPVAWSMLKNGALSPSIHMNFIVYA